MASILDSFGSYVQNQSGAAQLHKLALEDKRRREEEYQRRVDADLVGIEQWSPFFGKNTQDPSVGFQFAPADFWPGAKPFTLAAGALSSLVGSAIVKKSLRGDLSKTVQKLEGESGADWIRRISETINPNTGNKFSQDDIRILSEKIDFPGSPIGQQFSSATIPVAIKDTSYQIGRGTGKTGIKHGIDVQKELLINHRSDVYPNGYDLTVGGSGPNGRWTNAEINSRANALRRRKSKKGIEYRQKVQEESTAARLAAGGKKLGFTDASFKSQLGWLANRYGVDGNILLAGVRRAVTRNLARDLRRKTPSLTEYASERESVKLLNAMASTEREALLKIYTESLVTKVSQLEAAKKAPSLMNLRGVPIDTSQIHHGIFSKNLGMTEPRNLFQVYGTTTINPKSQHGLLHGWGDEALEAEVDAFQQSLLGRGKGSWNPYIGDEMPDFLRKIIEELGPHEQNLRLFHELKKQGLT